MSSGTRHMTNDEPPSKTPGRRPLNVNYERLRILAAAGIVCYHTQEGAMTLVAAAGLPVFLLLLVAFSVPRRPVPFRSFAAKKAARLLVPWAAWVAIYLLVDMALALTNGDGLSGILSRFHPLYGTRIHLWFLPFATASVLAVFVLHRLLSATRRRVVPWLLGACGGAILFGQQSQVSYLDLPEPLPQMLLSVPAVFWGLALERGSRLGGRALRDAIAASILSLAAGVGLAAALLPVLGIPSIAAYSIGLPLFCLSTWRPGRKMDALTRYTSPQMYGVYLSHPFVALILYRVPGFDITHPLHGVLILFVASALFTAVLRRFPVLRRLV